jgi:hypothetical protein
MTGVETIARIRFEHFQNRKGIKRIARELGIARDTVRKVLRSQVTEFSYKRTTQPLPKMGPWVEALTAILEAEATSQNRARARQIRLLRRLGHFRHQRTRDRPGSRTRSSHSRCLSVQLHWAAQSQRRLQMLLRGQRSHQPRGTAQCELRNGNHRQRRDCARVRRRRDSDQPGPREHRQSTRRPIRAGPDHQSEF